MTGTTGYVEYRTEYNEEATRVKIIPTKAGRPVNFSTLKLKPAYNGKLPLKKPLLDDLMWFVEKGHIPAQYQDFYKNLSAVPDTEGENMNDSEDGDDMDEEPMNDENNSDPVQSITIENDSLEDIPNVSTLEEGWNENPEINEEEEIDDPEINDEEGEEDEEETVPDFSGEEAFD